MQLKSSDFMTLIPRSLLSRVCLRDPMKTTLSGEEARDSVLRERECCSALG
jgi:hypothetical protein